MTAVRIFVHFSLGPMLSPAGKEVMIEDEILHAPTHEDIPIGKLLQLGFDPGHQIVSGIGGL